jgi:hypothetical protein
MINMTYINAEMELVTFAAEDVLATSNETETEAVVTTTKKPGADTQLPCDEWE